MPISWMKEMIITLGCIKLVGTSWTNLSQYNPLTYDDVGHVTIMKNGCECFNYK